MELKKFIKGQNNKDYEAIQSMMVDAYKLGAKLTKLSQTIGKADWTSTAPSQKVFAEEKKKELNELLEKVLELGSNLEIKADEYCADHIEQAKELQSEVTYAMGALFNAMHFSNVIANKVAASVLTHTLSSFIKMEKEDRGSTSAFGFAGAPKKSKAN